MSVRYDTERWAARRRPFDDLEREVVALSRAESHGDSERMIDALRYALSFSRLTEVRNVDGLDVDVSGINQLYAMEVREAVAARLRDARPMWALYRVLPELVARTRAARASVLEHLPIDRESLEEEVTTRKFALVCGGGGGAGYAYSGCFEVLDRAGLVPDLVVGTSIGALLGMFRARYQRFDAASLVQAAKRLSWSRVFRVLETESRYGLPAALRLYLRSALRGMFLRDHGIPLRMSDMEIPLYVVVAGITVDALKHDLHYYEHLLDASGQTSLRSRVRNAAKAIGVVREFLSRRDALKQIVCGRDPGTLEFDVLDAAGFSAAVPGVIHYDVLREDLRMRGLLDQLYAMYGITRLGEGGLVANVGAKIAWESVVGGALGRRNVTVLALDCFWPNARTPVWYPLQQAVRSANVRDNQRFCDVYLPLPRTLSPMNLVPALRDTLAAMQWGREAMEPQVGLLKDLCRPLAVLPDATTSPSAS